MLIFPAASSCSHRHLTLSLSRYCLSPLSSLLPLLSSHCCHANFPGDSVVMDTEQQGRSADVWCRSGMCTNCSRVCALVSSLFLLFCVCDPSGFSQSLSHLIFFYRSPVDPLFESLFLFSTSHHSCCVSIQTLFAPSGDILNQLAKRLFALSKKWPLTASTSPKFSCVNTLNQHEARR